VTQGVAHSSRDSVDEVVDEDIDKMVKAAVEKSQAKQQEAAAAAAAAADQARAAAAAIESNRQGAAGDTGLRMHAIQLPAHPQLTVQQAAVGPAAGSGQRLPRNAQRWLQSVRADGSPGPRIPPDMLAALRSGGIFSDDFKDIYVGPFILIEREKQLFDALGLAYVPPHMRGEVG